MESEPKRSAKDRRIKRTKRITRSYYLTEEAVDKVNLFADRLGTSASEVIARMIDASIATGRAEEGRITVEDRAWAKAMSGGVDPTRLVVYSLVLPDGLGASSGVWTGLVAHTDKGPVAMVIKLMADSGN